MYGTYGQPCPQYQEPRQQLVKVTGMEGARAYQMPPNSVAPLFDANEGIREAMGNAKQPVSEQSQQS